MKSNLESEKIYVKEKNYSKIYKYLAVEMLYLDATSRNEVYADFDLFLECYEVSRYKFYSKAVAALADEGVDSYFLTKIKDCHPEDARKEIRKVLRKLRMKNLLDGYSINEI